MIKKKSKSEKPKKVKEIIHIKLEYDEAKQGKKGFLNSQTNLLGISKIISNYKKLRNEEIKKKEEIAKKIKSIKDGINKLKITLPKYKKPDILLKKENRKITSSEKSESKKMKKSNISSIDFQLEEIQKKLEALQKK